MTEIFCAPNPVKFSIQKREPVIHALDAKIVDEKEGDA